MVFRWRATTKSRGRWAGRVLCVDTALWPNTHMARRPAEAHLAALNQRPPRHMFMTYAREAATVPQPNPAPRHVRLFRNNRNQAIRIPVEFELPGSEAIISRDGDRLVIEPVRSRGLAALLDSWEPLTEEFPEIADPPPPPKDIF